MTKQPLQLAVNLIGWRHFARRKQDKNFLPAAKRVNERYKYICQYCGFQAKEYQDVVNIDGNYLNNNTNNLITACCFCSQCLFLQAVGFDEMSGGQIIYMPEMSQADLNSFCHVLFCAITNDTGYKSSAQNIYRSFKFRSQVIEEKFGEGTSDPAIFGQLMIDAGVKTEEIRRQLFKNILLLPSRAKFRKQIEKWAASALEEITT